MKRIGLFLFYDNEGIVDDYVKYLLDDIVENLSQLCIIVNGELSSEGEEILRTYTDDIILRSNLGFDAGGWKDAMIDYYGFDKIEEFDELILFNDSFFGPIYPFKQMFDVMDKKDLDFWGITVHGEAPDPRNLTGYGYRPRYLQTYFLAFRKDMIKSRQFQRYWTKLDYFTTFDDMAFKHGAIFTKHFSDLGFKWGAYVDTVDIEGPRANAMSFHTFDMYDMIVNNNLPVIKRKAFKLPKRTHLRYNLARDIPSTMRFIDENTDYDVSLIYKYFLRTMDPGELTNILNLVGFIPKDFEFDFTTDKKVLVIAHLTNPDLYEYIYDYLKNIPEYIDILITTFPYSNKEFFEEKILSELKNNSQIIVTNPEGRDVAALLVGCKNIIKDYDYFCFIHDNVFYFEDFVTVDDSFRDLLWENSLASPSYINYIINEFGENPQLGMIVPPRPYHGNYFREYANNYWKYYYGVNELLKRMDIHREFGFDCPLLSAFNVFWAKYDALKPLFDLNLGYDDFYREDLDFDCDIAQAIERTYSYVVANQGYYTKELMTDDYGRSEINNFRNMFSTTLVDIDKNVINGTVVFNRAFYGFIETLNKCLNNEEFFEIEQMDCEIEEMKEENIELRELISQQSEKIYKQSYFIKELENSNSWKTTRPIRKFKSIFRKS